MPALRPILATMSTSEELAGRFFALWSEYLTALAADPQMSEALRRWVALTIPQPPASPSSSPVDAAIHDAIRPAADAAAAAGAFGERDAVVAELARRVDELAERVARLEGAGRPTGGARRRNPQRMP
ncbi:MAG TPA: hypothetical protein VHY35_22740 [Stellaceae bacterium]|nr:hypothetical protein [Stellaceae bacterium]